MYYYSIIYLSLNGKYNVIGFEKMTEEEFESMDFSYLDVEEIHSFYKEKYLIDHYKQFSDLIEIVNELNGGL